jgi:hypothetical protein
MHEDNLNLKESYKTAQAQLAKARSVCRLPAISAEYLLTSTQFIKSQDKLFKEQHAAQALSVAPVSVHVSFGTAFLTMRAGNVRRGGGEFPLSDQDTGRGSDAAEGKATFSSSFYCMLMTFWHRSV